MPDRKLRIIRVDCALIAAGLCAVTPFTVLAQDDLFAELRRCSLIDDGPARLECYDALSGRRSPAAGEVRQEAAAEPDQKKFDQTATGVTTSGQARVGEGLLDGPAADKTSLDQKRAEEVPANKEIADAKSLDDLGSETLPRGNRDDAAKREVRATVSRCEKDVRKKYLFYFENGQIWKQTSDTKLYFKECNFNVTITKDFFGYKMKTDNNNRQIRISRMK